MYSSDEVRSSVHNYGCVINGSVAWIANVLEILFPLIPDSFFGLPHLQWNGIESNGIEWNGIEWNGKKWNRIEWNGMK